MTGLLPEPSLIAAGQTPLSSCLSPQLRFSVNPRWSSAVALPSGQLIMSEKLLHIFSSLDLERVSYQRNERHHELLGPQSVCQTHGRCHWKWYSSKPGWFAWCYGYFCTLQPLQTITLSLYRTFFAPLYPCHILLIFIFCYFVDYFFISTVFVFVGVYFPAGDHCWSAGLHYLPRGKCTFCLEVFGSFSLMWHNFLHLSNTTKLFSSFSILHQFYLSFFCSSFSICCCIPSACCPVQSYPLYCFHTLLILFLPFSLLQCFPFCYQVMHSSNIQCCLQVKECKFKKTGVKSGVLNRFCTGAVECS